MDGDGNSLSRTVPVPLQRGHAAMAGFAQRRAQALTRHFEQAEAGNMKQSEYAPGPDAPLHADDFNARW